MRTPPQVKLFAGDFRFWQNNGGTLEPVIPDPDDPSGNQPVETDSFSFSYEAGDKTEIKSKCRGARYMQPIYSETLPGVTSVNTGLLELPPLIMARILFGVGSGATLAAGAVTDAALIVSSKDVPLQLPHRLLKATPAPVVEQGGTPLVAGTDYDLDLRRGQIRIKAVGVDVGDEDLTISYSYDAQVSMHIVGGATPTRQFYITGDMEERVSGENGELRIPQVNLTVDGDVDWLSSEPIKASLTGDVVIAAGEDAPYTFTSYKAAA